MSRFKKNNKRGMGAISTWTIKEFIQKPILGHVVFVL